MDHSDTDLVLVERVRKGDKKAFDLLVRKYQYRIRKLVSRFIRDPSEQEDVVQEAFIRAYRALGKFRGDSAFYTWLYRIAVNAAKNHLVAAGRQPPLQDVDVQEMSYRQGGERLTEFNTPVAMLENDDLVAAVKKAINDLSDELKEAILLREMDGLSYEDIAVVMRCPVGTVRSRIFRAREAIAESISHLVDGRF